MTPNLPVLIGLMMVALVEGDHWPHEIHSPLNKSCPDGQAIYNIESQFYNRFKDRTLRFDCRNAGPCSKTGWSDWSNLNQKQSYLSPDDAVIVGIMSKYDRTLQDRQFRFRVCHMPRWTRSRCYPTNYQNVAGKPVLSYIAPDHYALVGFYSEYDETIKDRIYKFQTCDIART